MSLDPAEIDEKIGRLMEGELRGRLEEGIRDLEGAVSQLEDEGKRRHGLWMIGVLRESLLGRRFEARLRHSGPSLIVTIPTKVVRELGLEKGDRLTFQINRAG